MCGFDSTVKGKQSRDMITFELQGQILNRSCTPRIWPKLGPHFKPKPVPITSFYFRWSIEEETDRREGKGRRSLLFGGRNSFNSMPHYKFSTRMIWSKGWIEEQTPGRMDASEQQTTTLPKWMFFQKLFFKSSLRLNGYMRHSSTIPKQLRQPVPSLLSVSSCMSWSVLTAVWWNKCKSEVRIKPL